MNPEEQNRRDAQGEAELNLECLRSVAGSSKDFIRKAVVILHEVESGEKDNKAIGKAQEYLQLAYRQLKSELDRLSLLPGQTPSVDPPSKETGPKKKPLANFSLS